MENFHKFFKTYPDMDMKLLNGFLIEYIEHCKDLGVGFLPIHDSSEADCCDDDPYDPYYGDDYDKDFDSIVWPSSAPGSKDSEALEELRRKMEDSFDGDDDDYEYDSFDYSADVQYVVASTSYGQNETFYFMGDKNGSHGFKELGCSMAERWGHENWADETVIDDQINIYSSMHTAKLIGTQIMLPDHFHSWTVLKRIYEVTKNPLETIERT
jgi:hypothetical protein